MSEITTFTRNFTRAIRAVFAVSLCDLPSNFRIRMARVEGDFTRYRELTPNVAKKREANLPDFTKKVLGSKIFERKKKNQVCEKIFQA